MTRKRNVSGHRNNEQVVVPTDQISIAAEVLARADQEITIRENGVSRKVPFRKAVLAAQAKSALEGSVYAQSQILKLFKQYDERRAIEVAIENAVWREYCRVRRTEIEAAKKRGEPEPQILPHPDDLIFEEGKPVRCIGPCNEAGLAKCRETQEICIQLLRMDTLEIRVSKKGDTHLTTALLLYTILQQGLPPRLRLGDRESFLLQERFFRLDRRSLLKEIYQGWKKCGMNIKRGKMFPPLDEGKEVVRRYAKFVDLAHKGEINLDALSRGHISDNDAEKLTEAGFKISRAA